MGEWESGRIGNNHMPADILHFTYKLEHLAPLNSVTCYLIPNKTLLIY